MMNAKHRSVLALPQFLGLRLFFVGMFFSCMFFSGMLLSCREVSVAKVHIIGGHPTAQHQPYFVQLVDSASASEGFCGGSLIAPRVVVTAAHCVDPAQVRNLHVVLGMDDGKNLHLNHPIKVDGLIVHPEYHAEDSLNDIAVLYLEDYTSVEFEQPVMPVAFARDTQLPESSSQKVRVVGLGNTTSIGWVFDGVIREVELGVLPLSRCDETYGHVDQTQICAGDMTRGGVDSCQGDSGGPMLAKDATGAWVLVGLVSYGEGCAQKTAPGVYTRVAAFASFIDESVEALSTPRASPDEEVQRLLKTHCVPQFGYIPFAETQGDNRRETIYEMHLQSLKLERSDQVPSGEEVDQCVITGHGDVIEATWLKVPSQGFAANPKLALRVTRGGVTWVSPGQSLHYREDNIHCQTSEGPVDLADLRNVTYVVFKDVIYRLGMVAELPADNQTTWGCSFGDASVEVYELATSQGKELAARIHHRSIGTVSVKLIRADVETQIFPRVQWQSPGDGRLVIENRSKSEDLFTWKLTCPESFTLDLANGQNYESTPADDGSGFEFLVDTVQQQEGAVLANSSVSVHIRARDGLNLDGCVVNDFWPVETEGAVRLQASRL
jgi:secreted trypsin-like serine protease